MRQGSLRRRVTLVRSLLAPSKEFLRAEYGDQPVPDLYVRRWRHLLSRTAEARGSKPGSDPATTPAPGPRPGSHGVERPVDPAAPRERRAPGTDRPADHSVASRVRMVNPGVAVRAAAVAEPVVIGVASRAQLAPLSLTRLPSTDVGEADTPNGTTTRTRQQRWADQRPQRPVEQRSTSLGAPPSPPSGPPPITGARPEPIPPIGALGAKAPESGVAPFVGGMALLVLTAIMARLGVDNAGIVIVPVAALLLAWSAARSIARRRPEEAWVGRWLVLGTVVKIAASYARYLTLIIGYEGVGDSTDYDKYGRGLAQAWMGNGVAPHLDNLKETNFLRWFTGVVYFCFGSNMIAGFFVFGLFALVGSYLWYRATADAVPFIDKRIYLGLVLFAPSIAFWPSAIGKESVMQLGIGAVALATAYMLRQKLVQGLLVGLAGGWLLWVVRPHLLALVTVASAFAYLVGRVRPAKAESGSVVARTIGLLIIGVLAAFAIGQAATFLGIKDLSFSSVEGALDKQSERNQTGSNFDNGGDYLSPVNLPRGAATVLLRPFPWETSSPFQLLASLESVLVAGLLVARFSSIRTSLAPRAALRSCSTAGC